MENKKAVAIIISLLTIIIFVGVYAFYRQNKEMEMLKTMHIPNAVSTSEVSIKDIAGTGDNESMSVVHNQSLEIKKHLSGRTVDIIGTIKDISGQYITAEASVVDFSKLDTLDYSISQDLPMTVKTYKLKIIDNTVFIKMDPVDLKVDKKIRVIANEKIYITDELTAVSIELVSANS